jgi:hypothetical protein
MGTNNDNGCLAIIFTACYLAHVPCCNMVEETYIILLKILQHGITLAYCY